jgi:hypothetical protein
MAMKHAGRTGRGQKRLLDNEVMAAAVVRDPEIMRCVPVFRGTRVLVGAQHFLPTPHSPV